MQEIISCPSCKKKLQVPEGLIGQDVQCPTCGATFTAHIGPAVSNSPGRINARGEILRDEVDAPKRDRHRDEERDYDRDRDDDRDYDVRRRGYESRETRRDLMPHRGSGVLTMGIISIVTSILCPIIAVILGPIAWTMGQNDMTEIRAGRMDPDGESTTSAGRICGIIGTIIGGLYVLFICLIIGLSAVGGLR